MANKKASKRSTRSKSPKKLTSAKKMQGVKNLYIKFAS
jgi:hypothetical protein